MIFFFFFWQEYPRGDVFSSRAWYRGPMTSSVPLLVTVTDHLGQGPPLLCEVTASLCKWWLACREMNTPSTYHISPHSVWYNNSGLKYVSQRWLPFGSLLLYPVLPYNFVGGVLQERAFPFPFLTYHTNIDWWILFHSLGYHPSLPVFILLLWLP